MLSHRAAPLANLPLAILNLHFSMFNSQFSILSSS